MSHPTTRREFLARTTQIAVAGSSMSLVSLAQAQSGSGAPTHYTPTWESVDRHVAAPEWFQDAKFGIYYHWGAFSTPAYGSEWYPREMYQVGYGSVNQYHVATYGTPTAWPYQNFINGAYDKSGRFKQFNPKLKSAGGQFDPNEWAQLFADAGARFAGPVSEHHDGFSMWNSAVNEWNSVNKGPKLNLLQLFATAIRGKNMKLMVTQHTAWNANGYYEYVPPQSDPSLKKLFGQLPKAQADQLWFDKLKEVIDQVQPDLLYQDFAVDRIAESHRLNFLAYYYNQALSWGKEVVATCKDGFNPQGVVRTFERGGPAEIHVPYFLTEDSISDSSWCHTQGMSYYSLAQLLHALIDRISKNGTMVLNVAPTAEGAIPPEQRTLLLGIGDYLKRFGESVYGTRAWTVYGEGPTKMGGTFTSPVPGTAQDVRYVRNKANTVLYATMLGWPGSTATLRTLALARSDLRNLVSVQLLGSSAGSYLPVQVTGQDTTGLKLAMPSASAPFAANAYVLKLTFNGSVPVVSPGVVASVYSDAFFDGSAASLMFGNYTAADLKIAGMAPSNISSMRIAPGYRLVGYSGDNFSGTTWNFTGDAPELRAVGANDLIVSLQIGLDPAAYFNVVNVGSGLLLDSGGQVAANSVIKQWTAATSTNLQWQLIDLGNGFHKLQNRTNGMVVDGGGSTAFGTPAVEAPWSGSDNQQWKLSSPNVGIFALANRATGLMLDSGGQVPVGSPVKQWEAMNHPNLNWKLAVIG